MRRLLFRPPNFRLLMRDHAGVVGYWLEHANSDAELREKYREHPFQIVALEPYDFVSQWKQRAMDETTQVLNAQAAGTLHNYKFRDDIWGELKQYLFLLARERCGYCEQHVPASHPGAVEHYRPKRKVEEEPGHKGYYWLAYDETNYVPSCTNCNSGKGKMNQFPVSGTRSSARTDDLTAEAPLLLNPFTEDPARHLDFQTDTGWVAGRTPIGEKSVEVYKLNRGHLVERRMTAMKNASMRVKLWMLEGEFRRKTLPQICEEMDFPSASLAAAKVVAAQELNKRQRALDEARDTLAVMQKATGIQELTPAPPTAAPKRDEDANGGGSPLGGA